jgi:hypothetical protein
MSGSLVSNFPVYKNKEIYTQITILSLDLGWYPDFEFMPPYTTIQRKSL